MSDVTFAMRVRKAAPRLLEAAMAMKLYHAHRDECSDCQQTGACLHGSNLRQKAYALNEAALFEATGVKG